MSAVSGIIAVGVALRLAVLAQAAGKPLTSDALNYAMQGRAMYEGTYADAYWPPMPGFLVSGLMHLLGETSLAERLAGLIPACLALPLTAAAVRDTFGPRASLISTLILALMPGQWLYAAEPRTESLVPLWVAAAAWTMRRWVRTSRPSLMLMCGMVIGLAGLTRAPLLFLGPASVAAIGIRHRGRPRRAVLPASLAAAGALLILLPWSYRNWRVTGAWVLVNTNGARNLYHANRPGSDRYLSYRAIYDKDGRYATAESVRLESIADPNEKIRQMEAAFWRYLREHPLDYCVRCLNRLRVILSWDLMPLARLRTPELLPLPTAVRLSFGAAHAMLILLLSWTAAAFCLRAPRAVGATTAMAIGLLALPYVLVTATPNYALAMHAVYVLVSGRVLARPVATWRFLRRSRPRFTAWLVAGLLVTAFSAEWTVALLRAGPQ